jgi:hypothetical protein
MLSEDCHRSRHRFRNLVDPESLIAPPCGRFRHDDGGMDDVGVMHTIHGIFHLEFKLAIPRFVDGTGNSIRKPPDAVGGEVRGVCRE